MGHGASEFDESYSTFCSLDKIYLNKDWLLQMTFLNSSLRTPSRRRENTNSYRSVDQVCISLKPTALPPDAA